MASQTPSARTAATAGWMPTPYRAVLLFMLLVAVVGGGGCAGYQFGPRALYRSDIRTVHVPVIRNDTFRHDLGVRLTEAVIREIESRTPYKVTGDPNADSVLTVRVLDVRKEVLTETSGDDPRALDAHVNIQAAWVDRSGAMLMQNRLLPDDAVALTFIKQARMVPEAGQSIESELQHAIDSLAQRIVSQMEMRW